MKNFTKLALATSIVAMSANSMAMTALDDAALSATTGQDGITIGIQLNKIQIKELYVHDGDGRSISSTATPPVTTPGVAGAIVIKGNGIAGDVNEVDGVVVTRTGGVGPNSNDLLQLKIDTDGGATGAAGAFLNIAAEVAAVDVNIGEIGVGKSKSYVASTNSRGVETTGYAKILDGLDLKLGSMTANVQLGNTPQGAMIKINSTITGGLEIANLNLKDGGTNGQGNIVIESIKITDAGGANLAVDADVNVTPTGLTITSRQGANGHNIYVKNTRLGAASQNSIGDVEIVGMRTTSAIGNGTTIRVTGH